MLVCYLLVYVLIYTDVLMINCDTNNYRQMLLLSWSCGFQNELAAVRCRMLLYKAR